MGTVVLVEDEPDLQALLAYKIRAAGHNVLTACTVREGVTLARGRGPDLVVVDVHLPDGSGLDLCRRLRADPQTAGLPIVAMSTAGDSTAVEEALAAGADDYVQKPFAVAALIGRLGDR